MFDLLTPLHVPWYNDEIDDCHGHLSSSDLASYEIYCKSNGCNVVLNKIHFGAPRGTGSHATLLGWSYMAAYGLSTGTGYTAVLSHSLYIHLSVSFNDERDWYAPGDYELGIAWAADGEFVSRCEGTQS